MFNKLVESVTDDLMKKGAFEKYAISNFSNEELHITKEQFRDELKIIVAENFSEIAEVAPDTQSTEPPLDSTLATPSDFTTATIEQLDKAWEDIKLNTGDAVNAVEKFATEFKVNTEKEISQFIQYMESKGADLGTAAKNMFNKSSNTVGEFMDKNQTPLVGGAAGAAGVAAGLVGAKMSQKKNQNFSNEIENTENITKVSARSCWAEMMGFSNTALSEVEEVTAENFANTNSNWMTFLNK